MPLSKRLKDDIRVYMKLLTDYQTKAKAHEDAATAKQSALLAVNAKGREIATEIKSCLPGESCKTGVVLVEIDGALYSLDPTTEDMRHGPIPYVRLMEVHK